MRKVILGIIVVISFACTDNQEINCEVSDLQLSVSGNTNADCNNGATIELDATGGSAPYLFRFDGSPYQDLTEFTGVSLGGPFLAEVQDANGCETSLEVNVTGNENTVSFTTTTAVAGCGGSTGQIEVVATGGDGSYQYRFGEGTFGSGTLFEGLASGTYQISVKDGSGCINVQGIKVLSGISYSNDVEPIIIGSCATTGCHVSGTARVDLTEFDNVKSNAESIKTRVLNGSMPKNDVLTDAEIEAIVCWVDDGASNN